MRSGEGSLGCVGLYIGIFTERFPAPLNLVVIPISAIEYIMKKNKSQPYV
jgi:hypothetical protein